ncbi:hypothetical protein H072_6645 [Dactylellina haptotyla CBS 200.50]|uniref:Nudix hydrolase domain-containing protein n=1 Tax=Dactylellina haptotyla (strain CBS 200.50) TaxID=1284197 RepID=S8A989_DACHA|nr:hypothetical protein H072_6645 [Dactylellina haptotyla CBS 200.50]
MGSRVLYTYMTTIEKAPPIHTKLSLSLIEDSLEEKMAVPNASYNIPRESSLISSPAFITGAGAVMFHRKSKRVLLVIDEREDERPLGWFLPKGRKDVGESLEAAALREAEEEGGYPCRLLPVPVPTRHPKKVVDNNILSSEPIYMHNWSIPPKKHWPEGGMYTCFWYVCEITDEDLEKVETEKKEKKDMMNKAQESLKTAGESGKVFMDYHELRYRSELFEYEEAQRLIDASIDSTVFGCVLGTAIELVQKLDEMEAKTT